MAKNLKINVKNAQLAQALKLGQAKKPTTKKKKGEGSAKAEESEADLKKPVEEAATPAVSETPPPTVEKKEPAAPKVVEPLKQEAAPEEESKPLPPAHPPVRPPVHPGARSSTPTSRPSPDYPRRSTEQPSHYRPPQRSSQGQPHYQKHTGAPGSYPPRTSGYPPRTGGYPPRTGGYPPQRPGAAPHYRRPGFTPPGGAPGGTGRPPYPPRREPYTPRPVPGAHRPAPPPQELPRGIEEHKRSGKGHFTEEPRKAPTKDFKEHKPAKKQEERTFDSRDRQGLRDDLEEQTWRKRRPSQKIRPIQQEEVIRPKNLHIRVPITIKDLASEMKLKASQLISKLFMKGVVLTLNDFLDDETTIQLLGHDFDCEITIDRTEEDRLRITDKTIKQEIQEALPESLILRPPVVAFMGHVDHGKTSLIDAIRKSKLAEGEAGAITQHIGAFKCHTDAGDLTILDTPGHEAFSAMRARGADVTDIVVLVIAGDEGMRTQTLEAIQQAQTANVPIVVALNKSDKPNFNAENVYRQLAENNLLPEVWGGQTITVNCSAVTKAGIKELLEMLALQAEVLELKANPNTRARGTVIESQMHKGMGAVATILVQNGTLRLGDALVFAQQFARVKTMHDEHGRELKEAGPSTPVKITGLSDLPEAGSEFIVVKSEKEAMEIAEKRTEGQRYAQLHQAKKGVESFLAEKATGVQKKVLNLILRADVQGSVEALKTSLLKIESQKVELNILSSAVGEISESDVQLAHASKATIIGFHTQIESHAENLIKQLKVVVKLHDIIYHAVDDVRKVMHSLLDKIAQENDIGEAEVKATFKASQLGVIAGCNVTDGIIKRSSHIRLIRNGQMIWKGPIQSLKRVKEDVREVSKGYECGIVLQNNNDVKVGDILQAFEITYLEQEL